MFADSFLFSSSSWSSSSLAQVGGVLHNTGQSLVFRPDTGPKHSLAVNVSAGPLAYRYQIEEVFVHYGTENSHGSEHRIAGTAFPAEVLVSIIFK